MQKKYTILFYINLCFTERELIQNVGYKCFEKTSCKEKKGDGGNCYTKRRDTQITRQLQISCHLQYHYIQRLPESPLKKRTKRKII